MTVATTRAAPAERTLADRFLEAAPLLSIFLWLCFLYGWEAWRHGTPWLFGDELQLTQLSRAIAQTGHAARRGQAYPFHSLYTYLVAPAWLIDNVHQAYSAVKYIGVAVMTSAALPTYGLARFLVGRRPALFAAAASALIPALVYTSLIVEEPLAYPYSTLCLFLIAGAFIRRTHWWIAGAVVASLAAPAARSELVVIPAVFALAALLLLWRSDRVARWRATWTAWDWVGAVTLALGAVLALSAFLGHRSYEWLIATGYFQHRTIVLGLRAAGAFTIGLGVLPVVAGLALLWRAPAETFRRELRVFRCVLIGALVGFGLYTAVKASYLSTTFSTVTVERNLIYLAPLLFVGCALWLERRRINPIATGAAAAFALYVLLTTPYEMEFHFYSDAPGLALLEWANRSTIGLTPAQAKFVLVVVLALSLLVLLSAQIAPRLGVPLAVAAATFVLAWNGGGELAAASASNAFSREFLAGFGGDPTWLDKATGGGSTLYLGQQISDPNGENVLEFWNRSLKQVWSLDGTAPGPGPTLTPDVSSTNGVLSPDPGYPYVVAEGGIDVVGRQVATHVRGGANAPVWRLFRVDHPLRLRGAITGLYSDGWSGPNDSAYTRYSTAGNRRGTVIIRVSRVSGGPETPAHVTITMGTLEIGPDHEPRLGRITRRRTTSITRDVAKTFSLPAPGSRFRVEVQVSPKFRPRDVSGTSDARLLGAHVVYRFSDSRRTHR